MYVHGVMRGGPVEIRLRMEDGSDARVLEEACDEIDLFVLHLGDQRVR